MTFQFNIFKRKRHPLELDFINYPIFSCKILLYRYIVNPISNWWDFNHLDELNAKWQKYSDEGWKIKNIKNQKLWEKLEKGNNNA